MQHAVTSQWSLHLTKQGIMVLLDDGHPVVWSSEPIKKEHDACHHFCTFPFHTNIIKSAPLIREIQWFLRFWHASTRLWFDFSYFNSFLIIRSPGFIALSLSIFDYTSLQRQTWLNKSQTIFWHSFLCSVISYPFGLDFRVLKALKAMKREHLIQLLKIFNHKCFLEP